MRVDDNIGPVVPGSALAQDLFVAYAQAEAPLAASLERELRRLQPEVGMVLLRRGIISSGASYLGWLQARLAPCGGVVALVSSQSTRDELMMAAVDIARQRAHLDHSFALIPVFVERVAPPHGLGIAEPLDVPQPAGAERIAAQLLRRLGGARAADRPLRPPGTVGPVGTLGERYALIERLGEGRRTTAYRARDLEDEADVVVKLLHPRLCEDPREVERFARAAEVAAALGQHDVPRLVPRHGAAREDDGRHFVVEALIPGPSLSRALAQRRLAGRDLLTVAEQVGQTLASLHALDHVHHHVTPSNILLDQAGRPWLTDVDPSGFCAGGPTDALAYCAPEVLYEGKPTDARADVFSLAMIVAFGLSESEHSADALVDRARFLAALPGGRRVRALLSESLRRDPQARPATVESLCERLREVWEGGDDPEPGASTGGLDAPDSPSPSEAIADLDRERVRRRVLSKLFSISTRPVTVGRFVLGERLGRGATGQVHVAYDPQLDREVAVKLVAFDSLDRLADEQRVRLLSEARALARVSQEENVVNVYEVDVDGDPPFIAMELVKGKNLAQWIDEGDDLPWTDIVDVFYEAGQGLAAAHKEKLIHRDFKPQNVMIDDSARRRVRVTDFGLARTQLDEPVVTQIGGREVWAGTPLYMAPEQVRNLATPKSDQFAFCVSLYECLFGEHPFSGSTIDEIQAQIAEGPPTPDDPYDVPPALIRLIQTGLAADPESRNPSMRSLLRALDALLEQHGE